MLRSDPVTLGTLTADSTGKISGAFTVPANTTPGAHELELVGKDATGAARSIKAGVTIAAAGAATSTTGGGSGGTLVRTGSDSIATSGWAAVVLGMGLVLLAISQRRRIRFGLLDDSRPTLDR